MIEVLIKYIQDKGYQVHVLPGILLIRKEAHGKIYGMDWAISSHDLCPDMEEVLYYQATQRCDLIEQAIAEAA
jgi:hypothetical protein